MFTVCLNMITGKLLHVYCFFGSMSTVLYRVSIKSSQGQQRPLESRMLQQLLQSSL